MQPAPAPETFPLRPGDPAPDVDLAAEWEPVVKTPTLTRFPLAARPDGPAPAVVVLPGGGYEGCATAKEGAEVARWLTTHGIAAFVLRYRTQTAHPAPLRDALRAIRTVRARAAEWDVCPDAVGVLGFSAGGHLAACASTSHDDPAARDGDPALDRVPARPDFAALIYPVISLRPDITYAPARAILLGDAPADADVARLSPDESAPATTPPTFLCHTADDDVVPVAHSLRYAARLTATKVPCELHVYPTGPHGHGLRPPDRAALAWPGLMLDWLRAGGWCPR